jgi:hypothetical protein
VLLLPEDRPRAQLAADVVGNLRRAGFAAAVPSGWEDHDATLVGSWLMLGELVSSSHPVGCVQLRVRRRLRRRRIAAVASVTTLGALITPWAAVVAVVGVAVDLVRGWQRTGHDVRFVVEEATSSSWPPGGTDDESDRANAEPRLSQPASAR